MGKDKLKRLFWDYENPYSADDLYEFLLQKKEIDGIDRNQLIAKMLITIRWYDLIDIFGLENMLNFLTDDVLKFIWKKGLRTDYIHARKILQRVLRPSL